MAYCNFVHFLGWNKTLIFFYFFSSKIHLYCYICCQSSISLMFFGTIEGRSRGSVAIWRQRRRQQEQVDAAVIPRRGRRYLVHETLVHPPSPTSCRQHPTTLSAGGLTTVWTSTQRDACGGRPRPSGRLWRRRPRQRPARPWSHFIVDVRGRPVVRLLRHLGSMHCAMYKYYTVVVPHYRIWKLHSQCSSSMKIAHVLGIDSQRNHVLNVVSYIIGSIYSLFQNCLVYVRKHLFFMSATGLVIHSRSNHYEWFRLLQQVIIARYIRSLVSRNIITWKENRKIGHTDCLFIGLCYMICIDISQFICKRSEHLTLKHIVDQCKHSHYHVLIETENGGDNSKIQQWWFLVSEQEPWPKKEKEHDIHSQSEHWQ